MGKDTDFVTQLTEASTEAKQVLHEMLSTIKEAHKVIKELDGAIKEIVKTNVEQVIQEEMDIQLEELGEATRKAMNDSVAKVSREFDKLTNIMMTGNKHGRSQDGFNIRDSIKKYSK